MFRPSLRAHEIAQAKRRDIERRELERRALGRALRAIDAARFAGLPVPRGRGQ